MAARANTRAYLDYNASAPLRPEAREAALAAFDAPGNPSSVHREGREARRIVEDARDELSRLAGVASRCVTFVSGGTEAAVSALNPSFGAGPAKAALDRLVISGGEHPCVLNGHRFPPSSVEIAPMTRAGVVDLQWLAEACARPGRMLLALQGANNETGAIQPVAAAAALVHAAGGYVFCDAVQLAGRADCGITALGVDALSLSAHKIGGPKGAGALVVARPAISLGAPLIRGGGQERGARAGTENVAAIAGFGAAVGFCRDWEAEAARLAALTDGLVEAARAAAPDVVFFADGSPRLTNTVCFAVPGLDAATLMIALDLGGVAVSSGSACSSGKVAPSHVLLAMGIAPELARGAIRLSLGWASAAPDVAHFAETFATAVARMRRHGDAA